MDLLAGLLIALIIVLVMSVAGCQTIEIDTGDNRYELEDDNSRAVFRCNGGL